MAELFPVKLWIRDPNASSAGTPTLPRELFSNEITSETCFLNVDRISKQISRQPSVFSLPELRRNEVSANVGEPAAFGLDFGLVNSDVVVLDGVTTDQGINTVGIQGTDYQGKANPSIDFIERYVRTSWRFSSLSSGNTSSISSFITNPSGGPRLTIPIGGGVWYTYRGLILNYKADRDGGNQYWKYSITFQVTSWPPEKLDQSELSNWPKAQ